MDFLKGFLGKLLQVLLIGVGIALLIGGIFSANILIVIASIVCFCAAGAIKYWLGHIVRIR